MRHNILKKLIFLVFSIMCINCLEGNPKKDTHFIKLSLPNEKIIRAEIAETDKTRAMGLMYRKYLAPDDGMLFIFDTEDFHSFWMKNTLIPLDILWLDKEFRIVYFYQNVPPCKSDPCPSYAPLLKARYVLEMNSGFIKSEDLKLDDKLIRIPEQ